MVGRGVLNSGSLNTLIDLLSDCITLEECCYWISLAAISPLPSELGETTELKGDLHWTRSKIRLALVLVESMELARKEKRNQGKKRTSRTGACGNAHAGFWSKNHVSSFIFLPKLPQPGHVALAVKTFDEQQPDLVDLMTRKLTQHRVNPLPASPSYSYPFPCLLPYPAFFFSRHLPLPMSPSTIL